MPFCEDCAKYWAPATMAPDGSCPSCGRVLEQPKVQAVARGGERPSLRELAGEDAKAPWHFKLLMVALAVYLAWRLLDLFGIV